MAKHRRKSLRTITPEQQAKMQEGRRKAQAHRARMEELNESGIGRDVMLTKTQRMLNSVRRKG